MSYELRKQFSFDAAHTLEREIGTATVMKLAPAVMAVRVAVECRGRGGIRDRGRIAVAERLPVSAQRSRAVDPVVARVAETGGRIVAACARLGTRRGQVGVEKQRAAKIRAGSGRGGGQRQGQTQQHGGHEASASRWRRIATTRKRLHAT